MASTLRNTERYPSEFPVNGPTSDYMRIECIERNFQVSRQSNETGLTQFGNLSYYNDLNSYELVDFGTNPSTPNTILMYMPQKISESLTQSWSQYNLQPTVSQALRRSSADEFQGGNIAKTLAEKAFLQKAITNLPKIGGTVTETAVFSASAGVIYNPMAEVLYDGPQYRTFNYSFTLFAKSEQDAKAIFNIVRFFQLASVPTYSTTNINFQGLSNLLVASLQVQSTEQAINTAKEAGGNLLEIFTSKGENDKAEAFKKLIQTGLGAGFAGLATIGERGAISLGTAGLLFSQDRFIKQPPLVKITYMRGSGPHPYINSPKACVITGLDIDYTPTGSYTIMNNNSSSQVATVIATNITLQLTEIKTVYREDYVTGVFTGNATANVGQGNIFNNGIVPPIPNVTGTTVPNNSLDNYNPLSSSPTPPPF